VWAAVGRVRASAGATEDRGWVMWPLRSGSGTVRLPSGFHMVGRTRCSGGWLFIASAPVVVAALDAPPHRPSTVVVASGPHI
jgi:hypothetical protein